MVETTTRYVVTLNDNFRYTYMGNDGVEHSRGPIKGIVRDLVIVGNGRALSEIDGYADLPDDAAEVVEEDFDADVWDLE